MKVFVYIFTLLATVNGESFIMNHLNYLFKDWINSYNDFMISIKAPDYMITKKLPPDWIPHSDSRKRNPESEKKF